METRQENTTHLLELEEGERKLVLLALAHVSVERPGWDDALNRIAMRIDNVEHDRSVTYDRFREIHAANGVRELPPDAPPVGQSVTDEDAGNG